MSLGYGYDVVLLLPRHPTDHDYELSQHVGALHWYPHSRQARTVGRRHAQRSHHHRPMEGDTMIRLGAPRLDDHATSLVEDLRGMSLAASETLAGCPVIPPFGAAPPVGARSVSPMVGSISPRTLPYGLNTAAQQYASSLSTDMRLRGAPWAPSTFCPRSHSVRTGFRVPGLYGDP
jgi:hypothetical protein